MEKVKDLKNIIKKEEDLNKRLKIAISKLPIVGYIDENGNTILPKEEFLEDDEDDEYE